VLGIEGCRESSGWVGGEVRKCLVAFDKVAVEVVRLAAGGAGDEAFVVVGEEVTNGADIAFTGCCVLRANG